MATTTCQVHFQDENGRKSRETFYFDGIVTDPDGADCDALLLGLVTVSAAATTGITLLPTDSTIIGATPIQDYDDIQDKLKVEGVTATGLKVSYQFPCPDSDIWNPDKETVDPADTDWLALVAVIEANFKGTDGSAVTVLSGKRTRATRKG